MRVSLEEDGVAGARWRAKGRLTQHAQGNSTSSGGHRLASGGGNTQAYLPFIHAPLCAQMHACTRAKPPWPCVNIVFFGMQSVLCRSSK